MLAAFSVRLSGLERPIENVGLESGLPSAPDMSPHRTNGRYVPATDHKYCSRTKFSSNGLGIGLATYPR
jgi:hypothetical protein